MKLNSKSKEFIGWSSIILLSLVPVVLFLLGSGMQGFKNFSLSLYTLGRIFALGGITLFALNFVLSTRLKFLEEIFGGLDKVYLVHGIVGGIAFMLILAHPILISASFIPKSIIQAASFFIPGSILFLDFGLIAIIGFISLIFITLFTRMKYNYWKYTHEFMGLVFILALLHIFLVPEGGFGGYHIFTSIIAIIGISAFSYSLIIRRKILKHYSYRIKEIRINTNIINLYLEPQSETKQLKYQSGQFVFLKFNNQKVSRETHPFSISSKSNDKIIRIILKESGDFTNTLINLKVGDKVTVEGPYGKFNFKNFDSKKQVWIAGGIGITPFLGMVENLEENPEIDVTFFYTFRENYIVDKKLFERMGKMKNLKFITWNSKNKGHINIGEMARTTVELSNAEILVCGPIKFKEEIVKQLRDLRISKDKIHEEIFDLK